jgi:hypothetical protein
VIAVWVVDQNNCLLVVKAVEILKTARQQAEVEFEAHKRPAQIEARAVA